MNWQRALTDDANWIGGCFEWYPTKESPVGTSTDVYWNDRPGATTGNYGGHKICVRDQVVPSGLTESGEYINSGSPCAEEGGTCACTDGVWYGTADKWYGPKQGNDYNFAVPCNNGVFGDPAPGIVKECRCDHHMSWRYPICSAAGGPMTCKANTVGAHQTFLIKEVD